MPRPRGNQPFSTGNNKDNWKKSSKAYVPKKNKKAKFQKAPKVAKKVQIDNKQSAIINKLSRQVYALQMAKYGKVQQNYHTMRQALVMTSSTPACLDLTDFTCNRAGDPAAPEGARIYQHSAGGVAEPTTEWSIVPYQNNYYWQEQNNDQPDSGAYLAMSATYFVQVKGINSLDDTRVRFDVISQKPDAIIPKIPSAGDPLAVQCLPDTLIHFKHLATPMGGQSNRINPVYFRKYFSKTIYMNSQPANQSGVHPTTANTQRFSFKIKPNKVCTQRMTNPIVGGLDPTAEVGLGSFGPQNVHPSQPLWLIISTDDDSSLGDAVQVEISRRVVWRDTIGSADL